MLALIIIMIIILSIPLACFMLNIIGFMFTMFAMSVIVIMTICILPFLLFTPGFWVFMGFIVLMMLLRERRPVYVKILKEN